jgi:hypothetical protein
VSLTVGEEDHHGGAAVSFQLSAFSCQLLALKLLAEEFRVDRLEEVRWGKKKSRQDFLRELSALCG